MTSKPTANTPEVLNALQSFSDEIGRVFRPREAAARPVATRQTQYVLASMAVAALLRDVGERKLAANFHKLAEALQDVVDGIDHPLFRVEKVDRDAAGKRGRQYDTSETWRVRASLCVGIQFLMAGGLSQGNAVSFVIRQHRSQLVNLMRPGSDLKGSLPTWIKSFATDAVSNDVALSSYKLGMKDLAALLDCRAPADIRKAGERLVASAAASAASIVKI